MPENIITAIIAAIAGLLAGLVGSVLAPWVNWGIEKRKERLANRRANVEKWREMVFQAVNSQTIVSLEDLNNFYKNHRDFFGLKPHLKNWPHYAQLSLSDGLLAEIARIETEWELA